MSVVWTRTRAVTVLTVTQDLSQKKASLIAFQAGNLLK